MRRHFGDFGLCRTLHFGLLEMEAMASLVLVFQQVHVFRRGIDKHRAFVLGVQVNKQHAHCKTREKHGKIDEFQHGCGNAAKKRNVCL